MSTNFDFRKRAVSQLPDEPGVYVLCDLANAPLNVGQSMGKDEGIRARVRRHLTSARSDIVANRAIDIWEVAFVWAYPITPGDYDSANSLEASLYHSLSNQALPLINGKVPIRPSHSALLPQPLMMQVMDEPERQKRIDNAERLPRQAEHYAQIVNHFLHVKNSNEVSAAMHAHFLRLQSYHHQLRNMAVPEPYFESEP